MLFPLSPLQAQGAGGRRELVPSSKGEEKAGLPVVFFQPWREGAVMLPVGCLEGSKKPDTGEQI